MIYVKFHLNSINFCSGFGPNCENTIIQMVISFPKFSFCSDDFTAKINLLALPAIATKFSLNATASEYVRHISEQIYIFDFDGIFLLQIILMCI